MSTRATAIARNDAAIEASQQRAIAEREANERRPKNALEAMASRLQVSPAGLKDTLMKTVFSACRNDAEFIALTVVSNEYGLNPLTKEIYAFPAKGGGIVPMVSVDGWIRIMNEHPQFDGIEFDYIVDQKGQIDAIEAVIHRKDRSHPIKVIEYLEECRRGTEPWKLMPKRMLRNRALIQGARIAFGFGGIVAEGDEETIEYRDVTPQRLPRHEEIDQQTGEIVDQADDMPRDEATGMTEVDEETARALDAGEQPSDEPQDEPSPAEAKLSEIRARIADAKTLDDCKAIDGEWINHRAAYDDDTAAAVDKEIAARRVAIRGGAA